MTEEEYQNRILELEEKIAEYETTTVSKDQQIQELTARNEKLLEHNNALFLRCSHSLPQDTEKTTEENFEDLISQITNAL